MSKIYTKKRLIQSKMWFLLLSVKQNILCLRVCWGVGGC